MPKPRTRHPHNALNVSMVRSKKAPGRFSDGLGLYLVVDQSGNKRWMLRITIQGKRRDIGLGGWPVVSLADARKETLRMRLLVMDGQNPVAEKSRPNLTVPTFRDAAKLVHEAHKASWRNQKHRDQWIRTLETYVFPHIGDLPVSVISSADVITTLSPIWLKKPETARRVRQRMAAVLDWAKAKGYREQDNPVSAVLRALPKPPKAENHHACLPYSELPSFLVRLRSDDAMVSTRLALEFLILTATRTSEVLHATWAEIDLQQQVWTIPACRMKANREFRVPLTTSAIGILNAAKPIADEQTYIFPGQRKNQPLSGMALLMLLRRMRLDVTTHGFRSTFRDWAAEQTNFPRQICEAALAHTVKDKTEAAYLRTDQFAKRRKLMDAWSRFAHSPTRPNVVSLRTNAS